MTSISILNDTVEALCQAVEGERLAQEVYAKFYFESRHASYAELAAEARLAHTVAANIINETIEGLGAAVKGAKSPTGPFAGDPRAAVSGIDHTFVADYLFESEKRNLEIYQDLLKRLDVPDTLKDAIKDQVLVRLETVAGRMKKLADELKATTTKPANPPMAVEQEREAASS